MKKILLMGAGLLLVAGIATRINAQQQEPQRTLTVQGIHYANPNISTEQLQKLATAQSLPKKVASQDFGFDDIVNWTGEGENQAALVLQWNVDGEENAIAFGYRWDGEATGYDMLSAIAQSDPRLYIMVEYTDYGYAIGGIGWDANGDGNIGIYSDYYGNEAEPSEDGIYICPDSYGYDDYAAVDEEDYWQAGWYTGYWSYYVTDSEDGELSYSSWGVSNRQLVDGSWDVWNFMPSFQQYDLKPLVAASVVSDDDETPEDVDYTNGFFILNEDWFGHNSSSINFYSFDYDKVFYRVFQAENPGYNLGNTSQYAQIFGDKMFIMSKQEYNEAGGRLIVADASTMERLAAFETLGNIGDGRAFVGVSPSKGYIGGSAGIAVFDIDNLEIGDQIDGISSQVGDMLRYGSYVFAAVENKGVYVIDTATDQLKQVIDGTSAVTTLFVTASGALYAATTDSNAEFIKINPVTFETETIDIEDGDCVKSTWGAWRSGSIACDPDEDIVYYLPSVGFWGNPTTVVKYDFTTGEYTKEYVTLPGDVTEVIYGTGIGMDPISNQLILTTNQDGASKANKNNRLHFVNPSTGEIENTVTLEDSYWFPAMLVYPDNSNLELVGADNVEIKLPAESDDASVLFDASTMIAQLNGNKNLVVYDASLSNNYFTVNQISNGIFEIAVAPADQPSSVKRIESSGQSALLTVTAEYNGKKASTIARISRAQTSMLNSVCVEKCLSFSNNTPGLLEVEGNGILVVYGLDGKVCLKERVDGHRSFDISGLGKGMYVIELNDGVSPVSMKALLK
jgi:hypothetical protein